uniref:Uncharacterized protein n=1 Tax=Ignisphaera aggregans TaxID=334771 RepID=A0A7C2V9C6_9CREN
MYRRISVNFCGDILVDVFSSFMLRSNEVAIKVSHSYLSVTDVAFSKCSLVASNRKALGSIAIGRVVDRGVSVEDVSEGSRAIGFVLMSPYYTSNLGGAQDIAVIDQYFVREVKMDVYTDLEALLIAGLSVSKDVVDELKGKDVVLIGEDISLLTFAYYAQKYSCKVGIVPRYMFLGAKIVKGEHISLHSVKKTFDVVVLAVSDPAIACLAAKNLSKTKGSMLILYPGTQRFLPSICVDQDDAKIKVMGLGDLDLGIKVFEEYRDLLIQSLRILKPEELPKRLDKPSVIRFA